MNQMHCGERDERNNLNYHFKLVLNFFKMLSL